VVCNSLVKKFLRRHRGRNTFTTKARRHEGKTRSKT
jgi:hypothetical protein